MLCTASDTFRALAYSTLCFFQVYAGIFNHIQTLLRHIQVYSDIFNILCYLAYSKACYILRPGIFTTGGLFKTLRNVDQAYSEPCHGALFSHIQNLAQLLLIQKPGLLRILEYSELFHNCIRTHIQKPVIFTKIYEYSTLWHI